MSEGGLSAVPTGWLEAFAVLVSNDTEFAEDIAAIYRMREIEQREGRGFTASTDEALAELANRKDPDGSQRRTAEIAMLTAQRGELEARLADYRCGPLQRLMRQLDTVEARLEVLHNA